MSAAILWYDELRDAPKGITERGNYAATERHDFFVTLGTYKRYSRLRGRSV